MLKTIKRALILRCGALGDLVYATSAIDALIQQYGADITIDIITTPGSGKLFEHDPRIHRVFPLKHKKVPLWFSSQKRSIVKASKEAPYDLLISLEFGKQFKSLIHAIDATKKIGMGLSTVLDDTSSLNRGEAIKLYFRDAIEPSILQKAKPILYGSDKIPTDIPSNAIIIAPSNSHNQKKGINYRAWPFEHWKVLIQQLSTTHPLFIVGARGEDAFFDRIKPYPANVTDLVGQLSIPELITTVQKASALICTDSATAHIGAAVDTPIFVLMGPNDPVTDSPYQSDSNRVIPISLGIECSPCYKTPTMKNCKENICMSQITPVMVTNALKSAKIIYNLKKDF